MNKGLLILTISIAWLTTSCDFEFAAQTRMEVGHPQVEPMLVVNACNSPYNGPVILPSKLLVHLSSLHSLDEGYFDDSLANALVIMKSRNTVDTLKYDPAENCYSILENLYAGNP